MTRSLEQERNALLDRVATLERQWEQDELRQKVAMLAELIRRQCDHLINCPAYYTPEPRPIHPRCTCGLSEAVRSLAGEANEWRRVFSERDEARAEVGRLQVELATQPYTPRVDVAAVVRWLEAEAADWDDTAARYPYLVHASENADLIRALAVTATAKLACEHDFRVDHNIPVLDCDPPIVTERCSRCGVTREKPDTRGKIPDGVLGP